MSCHHFLFFVFSVLSFLTSGAIADEPVKQEFTAEKTNTQRVQQTIERGLKFLEQDVVKWRDEHECSTCHHGTMTVWVYSEANLQGYTLDPELANETVIWAKERFLERIDKPRDTRPGWKMVSTPGLYLALMAQLVDQQEAVPIDELNRIGDHLLRHQEEDGSWAWSSAPPINRPPPFFESDEVATRFACLALEPLVADPKENSAIRDSLRKAHEWLSTIELSDTTQAAALRLLMNVREKKPADQIEPEIAEFLKRQNDDSGWGQLRDAPSDAYATGQALYVLSLAGVKSERAEIQRAIGLLVSTQQEDGSWPMKSRAHPGAEPYKNPVPITYFGSAWGTLGLMRCVPRSVQ